MAGKKQAVNQAAKKAASDGNITQKEADKLQKQALSSGANNAAVAIARAAANNQARIAESVQAQLGISQNKNLTRASTTQVPSGMDAYVSGFQQQQGRTVNGGSYTNQVPVYTFQGKKKPATSSTTTQSDAATANDSAASSGDQSDPAAKPMDPKTNNWATSVDSGLLEIEQLIKDQLANNGQQTQLYIGMLNDMMKQWADSQAQAASQQAAAHGAYALSSYQAPAEGAKTTQEIQKRKPLLNTNLSIAQSPLMAYGAGPNLAI